MAKYVIDIDTENPFTDSKGNVIYSSDMGFVCYGQVSTMEPLTAEYVNENFGELQDQAYQMGLQEGEERKRRRRDHDEQLIEQGRNEAWECAKRIAMTKTVDDCHNFSIAELEKIFGYSTIQNVFDAYSASEAIDKLKAYEQQKSDEIKVGDEVIRKGGDPIVVTYICGEHYEGMFDSGEVLEGIDISEYRKTGKHYDITELLRKMKED